MWNCNICLHSTKKRANVIRHLKLIHDIDDRDGKNVIKETNTGSDGDDKDYFSAFA